MTIPALTVADWLGEIAMSSDHPRADWLVEVAALMRTGISFDQAVSWGGYQHRAQTAALAAMVGGMAPGEVTAEAVHRRLTARHPDALAAAYIRAGGRTSLRSVHRRLAALRAANGSMDLAGDFAA
jgi:hypothetical protein